MKHFILVVAFCVVLNACGKNEETVKTAHTKVPSSASTWVVPANAADLPPAALIGKWKADEKDCEIKMVDNGLILVNQKGQPSKAEIKDRKVLVASDWRVKAYLSSDGKSLWHSNGTIWFR